MHENIRKEDPNIRSGDTSDCHWLLRSSETASYDLLEVDGDWTQWRGKSGVCIVLCFEFMCSISRLGGLAIHLTFGNL